WAARNSGRRTSLITHFEGFSHVRATKRSNDDAGILRLLRVADDDQSQRGRRSSHGGLHVEHPEIAARVMRDAGKRGWRAIRGHEAPNGRVSRPGSFATENVEIIVRKIRGARVGRSRSQQQEIAIVRN